MTQFENGRHFIEDGGLGLRMGQNQWTIEDRRHDDQGDLGTILIIMISREKLSISFNADKLRKIVVTVPGDVAME